MATVDLSSYLRLDPFPVAIADGIVVHVRPAKLADAIAYAAACPDGTPEDVRTAWLVWNHLTDDRGARVLETPEQASRLDWRLIAKLREPILGMYDPNA